MVRLLRLAEALLALTVVILWPFAWIMRDGLGPDARESQGVEAVFRASITFYVGILTIVLVAAVVVLKRRTRPM